MAELDAGWEAACEFQLERTLQASVAQRLAWLEQAIELAYASGALPRPDPRPDDARS